ncbi:Guanine nucleotide-binding protein, beta subunit [Trema orientale]|uniref:Guanine nucleotide-binding protein, beta subunit n=1 Tax=Trema orientale TaxID=63057 RepID=A0A2P5C0R0_TREOI|nr:Guanine nucleotide-binding protein, beta subunit [Trema orientale]
MEDEAEIYDGIRARFPLTFGKQSKSQTPLELIHNATRRGGAATTNSNGKPSSSYSTKTTDLPSISSSSKSWLDSLRNPKTRNPNFGDEDGDRPMVGPPRPAQVDSNADEDEGGYAMFGPPRPPPGSGGGDVEDEDGDVMVGPPPPPPGSGESDEDGEMIGPPKPPPGSNLSDSDEDEDDEEQEEEENRYRIPMSNEIVLKGHTKVVSALAIDHSGSRVLSGSYDYSVRMYDFQGMNSRLQSFRQLEPFEGHQVRNLSWSPTADRFLCVTGSAQAKIYDRDGLTLGEFVKGDMYIRDLKNTKGHISGLTWGEWHPKTKETILTSSEDGSLRIWDVNDFKSQKQVIKPKLARPARVPVTTCTWDREGKCIAGGIGDGSIQIWNLKPGWGSRPDIYVEKGHSDDITALKFSSDGRILLSRSFDGSLKVWDLRQMKSTLKMFEDLPNHYAQTNIAFSPDEQLFLTGISIERESTTGGLLCFFDRAKLELVSKVGISPTCSVVQCAWHPKLNQIFATSGDKSQGGTHILYDPTLSERGALVCVARAPRKKSVDDFEAKPVIHNPHALPLFRDQPSRKRQREKILKDPMKSHKPELPMTGPGFGGRIGTSQGSLLTQYLLKQGGMIKETWMDEDPREAILKYADVAAKDPKFIAPAYASTQPEPVFAKSDSEDEEK